MEVRYQGKQVYFLRAANPGDTLLVARFDHKKRLKSIDLGSASDAYSDFKPTVFHYTGDQLTSLSIAAFGTTKLQYDAHGNITRMYRYENEPTEGTFFSYDRSVSATRQWYSDHFRNGTENTVFLAQAMGWLPDLEPVNKRTSYKIVLHDEDPSDGEPGYTLIEGTLTNHVYDSEGRLTYYKDNAESFTNTWNCTKKNSN
jgi:YD repeat-containing protein